MEPASRSTIDYAPVRASRLSLSTNLSTKWLYWTLAIVLAAVLWLVWPDLLKQAQVSVSESVLSTALYDCDGLTISRPYNNTFHTFPIGSHESSSLRLYAGQVDPVDASRFSIRYTLDGKDGTIHGRLSERGDSVRFEFPAIAEVR